MEVVMGLPLNSTVFVGHLLGPEGQRLEVRTKGRKLPAAVSPERDLRSGTSPACPHHVVCKGFHAASLRPKHSECGVLVRSCREASPHTHSGPALGFSPVWASWRTQLRVLSPAKPRGCRFCGKGGGGPQTGRLARQTLPGEEPHCSPPSATRTQSPDLGAPQAPERERRHHGLAQSVTCHRRELCCADAVSGLVPSSGAYSRVSLSPGTVRLPQSLSDRSRT